MCAAKKLWVLLAAGIYDLKLLVLQCMCLWKIPVHIKNSGQTRNNVIL